MSAIRSSHARLDFTWFAGRDDGRPGFQQRGNILWMNARQPAAAQRLIGI